MNTNSTDPATTTRTRPTVLTRHAGRARLSLMEPDYASAHLDALADLAALAGEDPPRPIMIDAVQIFFRDLAIEEVRLCGMGEAPWHTATRPRLALDAGEQLRIDPADEGRCHLSAKVILDAAADRFALALAWDMEIPLALPPTARLWKTIVLAGSVSA